MRSEGGLDNHLATDLTFEQLELGVRCKTLGSVNGFTLNLKDLVSND